LPTTTSKKRASCLLPPPAGFNTSTINTGQLPADVDICVDANFKTTDAGWRVRRHHFFWGIDYDNYYSFQDLQ